MTCITATKLKTRFFKAIGLILVIQILTQCSAMMQDFPRESTTMLDRKMKESAVEQIRQNELSLKRLGEQGISSGGRPRVASTLRVRDSKSGPWIERWLVYRESSLVAYHLKISRVDRDGHIFDFCLVPPPQPFHSF